ncbi:MAG: DUF4962 domain-containing protein [Candidatus Omnitrophica bacterium]|nr:DUF4962 domain-containing protein [Candidatus Omnitrophota bacterium]
MSRTGIVLSILILAAIPNIAVAEDKASPLTEHPRLFFTVAEKEALLEKREKGAGPLIWKNLIESADWCLTKKPRKEWIAPVEDDPIYENLYDRFYAMMMDMAIIEHFAFAYALSGEEKYGNAVHDWTLSCVEAWRPDAEATPDGGKAYAVSRLLKGIATSYDLAHDRFTDGERARIREMLAQTASNYYKNYFTTNSISGPGFHTHHAIVEFGSFGIVALALLGEVPEASDWLDSATRKFEDHLLPTGLAPDGAQTEGATFWASTMHYRLFFMDALRRVTGKDLFTEYKDYMNADLALASIATIKEPGWNETNQTVILEPPYGQLDYYSPVLLCLAREYRRPVYQRLALWDHSLGHIQKTRYITPNRKEQLLFELGGYAYLWYDPTVPTEPVDASLSYQFDSVGQAYARGSWDPGGLLVAIDKAGQVVIHAGGIPILNSPGLGKALESTPGAVVAREESGTVELTWVSETGTLIKAFLKRPDRLDIQWEELDNPLNFTSFHQPQHDRDRLIWGETCSVTVLHGEVEEINSDGTIPQLAVGNGKLRLIDPISKSYPMLQLQPAPDGKVGIQIHLQ